MVRVVIFDFWGVIYNPRTGKCISGLSEFLDVLDARDIHYGIASSSGHSEIEDFLYNNNLADRFTVIVGYDDVKTTKPNSECYIKVAKYFEVEPERALVIDDSISPIESAKCAGFQTILFGVEVQGFDDTRLLDVLS